MLLPTEIVYGRVCNLLRPIRAPANRNRRNGMTDQVISGKGELHACPANFVPTSPPIACYTLHNRIVIFLIYSDTLRNLYIGRLMLILNESHPEHEQVSSLPQGCDEMSPLVEEYTSLPS